MYHCNLKACYLVFLTQRQRGSMYPYHKITLIVAFHVTWSNNVKLQTFTVKGATYLLLHKTRGHYKISFLPNNKSRNLFLINRIYTIMLQKFRHISFLYCYISSCQSANIFINSNKRQMNLPHILTSWFHSKEQRTQLLLCLEPRLKEGGKNIQITYKFTFRGLGFS